MTTNDLTLEDLGYRASCRGPGCDTPVQEAGDVCSFACEDAAEAEEGA